VTGNDRSSLHLRATLILACLAQFMVILDVSVVNVALPAIRHALGFTEANLQWVVNAYTVTFAGCLLLGGRAADLLGRRRVFVAGLVLFAVSSLVGGLSQSQGMLIGARALQGLGGAVIAPASLAILTTTFAEGPERNRAVGVWGAMGGAGGAAGVLLGGILTDALSWRWILFINVPIGLGAAALTIRYVAPGLPAVTESRRRFDLSGAITATLGLSLLVLGIVRTDATGWGAAQTLALIAAGVALVGLFVAIEGRFASAPLMPLRIYSSRMLSAANVVMLLVGAASFAMWFFVSLYLQQVLGYSPIEAGLTFLPMALVIAGGSTFASRGVARVGARRLLSLGLLAQALGLLLFAQVSATGSYLSDVLAPSLLVSLGIGLSLVPATICAVSGVAPSEAGLASALINTARLVGGALGLAVLATLATSKTKSVLPHGHFPPAVLHAALTDGFHVAFVVAAGVAFAGVLAAAVWMPRPLARAAAPAPAGAPAPAPAAAGEAAID
jgi:EmrB/QacA subfamily drug resistance transporter